MRRAAAVLVAMTAVAGAKPATKPTPATKPKPARWQTLTPPKVAPPAPSSTGSVDTDGASIFYAVYGTVTSDPVILLHGGMGNGEHWALQVPALVDKHQVITIDERGQGRSTRPKGKPTYDAMANDVVAVMDALKLPKASVVGWSDGGEIGLKLAIEHPARLDKLFIMGANYDANGSKPRGKPSSTFAIYAARCKADYAKQSKTPKQWTELVQWLLPLWKNPMGFTKEQLQQIKAPTMVADGDHDEIIELAQIEEMSKLIPNASLHVFEDASHFVLWQDPDSLNSVLADFLAPTSTK
jgi:pimeloyl-ACP methyl ester carboxylesterase